MSEQTVDANVPQWDLADRLRKSLREADVSVQEMAEYLEVSRNTVGSWINGHHRPRSSDLKQWALRCGVPYRWLTNGEEYDSGSHITALIRDPQPSTADILAMRKALGHGQRHPNARAAQHVKPRET